MRALGFHATIAVVLAGCVAPPEPVGEESAAVTGVQQGVDRAGAFSPSEAMSLKSAYGVTFTGVYIGGPCSAGSGWTANSVTAIFNAVGWQFLPIFVGQQSAAICGHDTLTEAQGVTDGNSAVTLMGNFMWAAHDHIPLALDLEAGAYSASPSGATSYVKGFADTVSAAGYDVYVYSSVTALNALASANLPITGAWPAYWLQTNGGFKSGLAPSQVPGLSAHWSGIAGAWQYNSGTSVVGDVDYDVADFVLAPAPGKLLPPPDAGADAGRAIDGGARDGSEPGADAAESADAGRDDFAEADQAAEDDGGKRGAETARGCAMMGAPAPSGVVLLALLFAAPLLRRRRRA